MGPPPFVILDGYRDMDREGRDYVKPENKHAKYPRTEFYQYFIPFWRSQLFDNKQGVSQCGFFEAQWYSCLESFGARLGVYYCDLEQRDLNECITNDKKMKRFQAMRDLRLKQWLRGDRKGLYESVDQLMDEVKPDRGGMGRTRATEAAKAAAAKAAQEQQQQQETNAQTEAKN